MSKTSHIELQDVSTEPATPSGKRLPHFLDPTRLLSHTPTGWVANTYTRCSLRCVYCCTRAQGRSNPVTTLDNIVPMLEEDLKRVTERPKPSIGIGCLVDAYVPEEAELGLTRVVLAELLEREWPMAVVTKSPLVWRDHDLLTWKGISVQISVSSLDDEALLELEPHVPPASERFEAVEKLAAAGVDIAASVIPWIPGISNLDAIIERLPETVTILVGPLDVQAEVVGPGMVSRRYDQQAINDAYLAEMERVGNVVNVAWRMPVHLPGTQEGADQSSNYATAGETAYRWLMRNRNVPREPDTTPNP